MHLVIQKYGGTSVGNSARIRTVAERVRRTRQQGYDVVVVVSAMAGETDRLLHLAQTIAVTPTPRELDLLLATGEMVAVALVAMALQEAGCQAEALTGMQAGIVTDETHTAACITHLVPTRVCQALAAGVIPVVAGFQGVSSTQDITTLGRGGSDLTAVSLAAALQADLCEIYTDVDGVYSDDPRKVLHAQRLEWISYEDMLVMAGAGAKVLQARAVECAWQYSVPVVVKSSFTEGGGTLVSHAETAADAQHWAA